MVTTDGSRKTVNGLKACVRTQDDTLDSTATCLEALLLPLCRLDKEALTIQPSQE